MGNAMEAFVDKVTSDVKTRKDARSSEELLSFEKSGRCDEYAGEKAAASVQDDAGVIKAVDAFWASLKRDFNLETEDMAEEEAHLCLIGEAEYSYLHLRVQKAVMPDFKKREALEIAKEEYAEELEKCAKLKLREVGCPYKPSERIRDGKALQQARRLDYTAFFAAIFEIVDSWTEETDAHAYAQFLLLLHSRITDGLKFLPLEDITYCAALESFQHTAKDVCPLWDREYIGGVGAGRKKDVDRLRNYEFSKDGHTAMKSPAQNQELISVIRAAAPIEVGVVTRLRVRVECFNGKLKKFDPA